MKRIFCLSAFLFFISYSFCQHLYENQSDMVIRNNKTRDNSIFITDINQQAYGKSPREKAYNYLSNNWLRFNHFDKIDNTLKYKSTRQMKSGDIVRFKQHWRGLRVGMNGVTIKIDKKNNIRTIVNTSIPIPLDFDIKPSINEETAYNSILQHFNISEKVRKKYIELIIHADGSKPKLAYEIWISTRRIGNWSTLVDAKNGKIITAVKPSLHANGRGWVFSPSPTASAKKAYGEGNYIDDSDNNNSSLENQTIEVDLLDITLGSDNLYYLIGPFAQIIDEDVGTSEEEGLFGQPTSDFLYNRSDQEFEAVMCYHYIDKSIRYVNEEMGIDVGPTYENEDGSLWFDPHSYAGIGDISAAEFGWFLINGERTDEVIRFGEGDDDVDMGEDALIISHESAHAVHFWLTETNISNYEGVSEAIADYWGHSSVKTCGQIGVRQEWEPEYHEIFQWGGMPSSANQQRSTAYAGGVYDPGGNNGTYYNASQYLSTALMKIFSDLGKDKTDQLLLDALPLMEGAGTVDIFDPNGTGLRSAGILIYEAAVDLGFSPNELCMVYNHLDDEVKISTSTDPPAPTPPSGGTLDIYMKDGPCDSGEEINFTTHAMFHSPDIWVRHENDNKLEHQNPEYKTSGSNWVHVRIRSRGCESYGDVKLHLYWSKASTGLNWPGDWTTTQVSGPNGPVPGGGEITSPGGMSVPLVTGNGALESGEEKIVKIPWTVPDPADYDTGDNHHFCLLARLVIDDDPMTYQELSSTGGNARKNNNITAKNVSIFDSIPGNIISEPISVYVKCKNNLTNGGIKVESAIHPLGKSIYDYGNVYLEMEGNMESDWINNGMTGSQFQLMQDGKIKALDSDFHLESLNLSNCSYEVLKVYFEPFADVGECAFDVVQYDGDGVEGTNTIGRERFEYYPSQTSAFGGDGNADTGKSLFKASGKIIIYPNPALSSVSVFVPFDYEHNSFQYQLFSLKGNYVSSSIAEGHIFGGSYTIPLDGLSPGIYLIKISDMDGKLIESQKIIKQ